MNEEQKNHLFELFIAARDAWGEAEKNDRKDDRKWVAYEVCGYAFRSALEALVVRPCDLPILRHEQDSNGGVFCSVTVGVSEKELLDMVRRGVINSYVGGGKP